MLKKIAIAATLALSATATLAADTGFYAGADVGSTKFDGLSGRKTSFGGFAGYQFTENLAVEGAYRRLGTITVSGIDVDANQAALSLVGIVPVGNGFKLYGRLGYNNLEAKATANGTTASASTSGALFGIGMSYSFAPNVSARLEVQRPSSDSTNINVGVAFKF